MLFSVGLFFLGYKGFKNRKNPFISCLSSKELPKSSASLPKWHIYTDQGSLKGYENYSLTTFFEENSVLFQEDQPVEKIVLTDVVSTIAPQNLMKFLSMLQMRLPQQGILEIRETSPIEKWKKLEEEPSLEKKYKKLRLFFSEKVFWEEDKLIEALKLLGFAVKKEKEVIQATKVELIEEDLLWAKAQEAQDVLFSYLRENKDPFSRFLEKKEKKKWGFSEVFTKLEPLYHKTEASKEEAHHHHDIQKKRWVACRVSKVEPSAKILDLSKEAGKYQSLFINKDYQAVTLDNFWEEKLEGQKFDHIFCLDSLVYMAEPALFLQRLSKHLSEKGKLYLSAPLSSGVIDKKGHYFGGLAPAWYEHFLPLADLSVESIQPCGGFFQHLAQECARVAWTFEEHAHLHGDDALIIKELFEEILPPYLYELDPKVKMEAFTEGYFVIAEKKPSNELTSHKVME